MYTFIIKILIYTYKFPSLFYAVWLDHASRYARYVMVASCKPYMVVLFDRVSEEICYLEIHLPNIIYYLGVTSSVKWATFLVLIFDAYSGIFLYFLCSIKLTPIDIFWSHLGLFKSCFQEIMTLFDLCCDFFYSIICNEPIDTSLLEPPFLENSCYEEFKSQEKPIDEELENGKNNKKTWVKVALVFVNGVVIVHSILWLTRFAI